MVLATRHCLHKPHAQVPITLAMTSAARISYMLRGILMPKSLPRTNLMLPGYNVSIEILGNHLHKIVF